MTNRIDPETGEIRVPFMRTAWNYDMDKASDETGQANNEPSMTQQHFKEDADINTIVERFGITGKLPDDLRQPVAGDYEDVVDFHTAMNAVLAAKAEFMKLPGNIRAYFEHDPQKYLEFFDDPNNREEAQRLGLLRENTVFNDAQPAPEPAAAPPANKDPGAAT